MSPEKMIKRETYGRLSGNWPLALAATGAVSMVFLAAFVLILAAYNVLGDLEIADAFTKKPAIGAAFVGLHIAGVALLIVMSPIITGFARLFSKIAAGEDCSLSDLFLYFENGSLYKKAVSYLSVLIVKVVGIYILCLAPAIAMAFVGKGRSELMKGAVALAVVGVLAAYFVCLRFIFELRFFAYDGLDGKAAAEKGSAAARLGMSKIVKLTASYFFWILSLVLVLPFLYVVPYMSCAHFVSAKYLSANVPFGNENNVMKTGTEAAVKEEPPTEPLAETAQLGIPGSDPETQHSSGDHPALHGGADI